MTLNDDPFPERSNDEADAGVGADGGWRDMEDPAPGTFQGKLPALQMRRRDGPRPTAQMRFMPDGGCANLQGGLHGGFLAAVAEQSLFLPLYLHGRIARDGIVVVDFQTSFMSGGALDQMIVADVELLRETGRMGFVRGTLSQDGAMLAHYSATVRKIRRPAASVGAAANA